MKSKIKPKEVLVNLPAAHLFNSEEEITNFVFAINSILTGKRRIKYDNLGLLGQQYVAVIYLERNKESQDIHDQFATLIEQEEIAETLVNEEKETFTLKKQEQEHGLCSDCDMFSMLHKKGLDHCWCGDDWINGKCLSLK
jgi:hypothetical protein